VVRREPEVVRERRPGAERSVTARIGLLALALCVTAAGGRALAADTKAPRLQVVVRNLDNPRKLFAAPGGVVYVTEAGSGGNKAKRLCLRTCVGATGSVVKVVRGVAISVLTGLGSQSLPGGRDAQGPVAAMPGGSKYVVLMQDMQINSHGVNEVGLQHAGDLLSSRGGKLAARVIADLGRFEAEHNPDHGAGPGPSYAQPPIDSDPYAFVPFDGGYAVVDAAGNDLLQVDPAGKISVLAVFPTRPTALTPAERKQHRPAAPPMLPVQSVPSALAVGPDGALYVGEFTGWPYRVGAARVWRVVPGKKPTVFASGFTNISDLAFDGRDLLVLELASKGLQTPGSIGELIRLGANGTRTVLASTGLVEPTGLAVGGGWIYISNYGTYPAAGAGPHGELVRIRG
jgi:hypothetical protein